jgi:hypothetical protein
MPEDRPAEHLNSPDPNDRPELPATQVAAGALQLAIALQLL